MKFVHSSFVSLIAVFAPIKAVILVTGFLILVDLITGIMAAKKRGESISSSGIRRTVTKMLVYNLALVSAFLIETYLVSNVFPITKIVSSIVGITEGVSIFENLNCISGTNIFKKIIDILGSKNEAPKTDAPK